MRLDNANESKKNRKRNRLIFRLIVLTVLVAAVAYALIMNAKKGNTIYGIGDQAPDFQLQQVNKNNELETIQLSDLEGKGVMLNFWATWCKPCEAEMPYMEELYPKYRDNGIEIVAVSLDSTEPVIHQFIEKYNLTFPILYDNRKEVNDLYKIGPIPSTYFIDEKGEIVEKVEGGLTLDRLEGYFKKIQPETDK
ncbi:MAG TPA: thiol-disulfide oxidoreductase ResA [Pseudogracilibacillus sp.]|nr:thiol-disulfide oxidoreductase ResA [Pseudogracilibacillus sp.]